MLAHLIVPKLLAQNDRVVKATGSRELWYHISGGTLFVPPDPAIRMSPSEAVRYYEAVVAFSEMDITQVMPDPNKWKIPYRVIDNADECVSVLEQLTRRGSELFTCDIECSHTGWDNQNMLLLGIKPLELQEVQIIGNFRQCVLDELNVFFRQPAPFNWHNGKFDVGRLHRVCRVRARVDEDTMLLHYCGINEKKGTHGLKDLAPTYLNAPHWDDELDEYKRQYSKLNKIKIGDFIYDYIPRNILAPYLAMDCTATEQLLFKFRKIARPECAPVYHNLIRASNVYAVVEENGNYVDKDWINKVHIDLSQQIEEAEDMLEMTTRSFWNQAKYMRDTGSKSADTYFNYKSPKQLSWLLHEVTGANIGSTDKDALEDLLEQYPDAQFIRSLVALRKLQKMQGTYVDGIRDAICEDGRVHASYNLHGTETGRLSCSEPNMQNIPRDKKIKNIFRAAPGNILVQLDYSQAELRCLAYLSDDDWLTGVFERDEDLHDSVATEMFGPNFTKEDRVKAKTVNFGIAYGRGAQSLMLEFGISLTEASGIISKWFEPMPKVKAWIEDVRMYPMRNKVFTTPFGRQRSFVVTNSNYNAVQNESINFPVSSIATDLTVCSLIEIYDTIVREGHENEIMIVNNVHDSIIFECRDDPNLVKWLANMGCEVMKNMPTKKLPNCRVPFKADAEVGYSWGALEKLSDYIAK